MSALPEEDIIAAAKAAAFLRERLYAMRLRGELPIFPVDDPLIEHVARAYFDSLLLRRANTPQENRASEQGAALSTFSSARRQRA
jgi:hypothetical protein